MTSREPERRGWYDDPDGTGQLRYWDGRSWVRYWDSGDGAPQRSVDVVATSSPRIRNGMAGAVLALGALGGIAVWGLVDVLGAADALPARWQGTELLVRVVAAVTYLVTLFAWARWSRNVARTVAPQDPAVDPALTGRRRRQAVDLKALWAQLVPERWINPGFPAWLAGGLMLASFEHPTVYQHLVGHRGNDLFVIGADLVTALCGVFGALLVIRTVRLLTPAVAARVAEGLSPGATPSV